MACLVLKPLRVIILEGEYIMRQTISSDTFVSRRIAESINPPSRHSKPKLGHLSSPMSMMFVLWYITKHKFAALWALRHDLRLITRFTANPLSLFRDWQTNPFRAPPHHSAKCLGTTIPHFSPSTRTHISPFMLDVTKELGFVFHRWSLLNPKGGLPLAITSVSSEFWSHLFLTPSKSLSAHAPKRFSFIEI